MRIYVEVDPMAQFAKVFRSGNSQAVRLPKEFRFDVEDLEISREGEAVILRPAQKTRERWSSLRGALDRGLSEDFLRSGRDQPEAEDRPERDTLLP
jgi:antitoxin VapB